MTQQSVTPFLFEGEALVRVVRRESRPWFVAADVCRAIGIKNPTMAIAALDDDERAKFNIGPQAPEAWIITEGGLYTLVLRSREATKPGTLPHRFRRWVTDEVLPSIRQTGGFGAQPEPADLPETVESEGLKLRMVSETRLSFGTRASRAMWLALGLPTVPAMFDGDPQPDLYEAGHTPHPENRQLRPRLVETAGAAD